jgi:hypothetical protein
MKKNRIDIYRKEKKPIITKLKLKEITVIETITVYD